MLTSRLLYTDNPQGMRIMWLENTSKRYIKKSII